VATFNEAAQLGVRIAVAKAAGVHRDNVRITGIKAVGRRLAEAASSVSFDVVIDVFSAEMLKTVEAEVKAVVQDSHTADDFTALVVESMVASAKAAGATDAVVVVLEAATAIATASETKDLSTAKNCRQQVSKGAIHWSEEAATGNWGPYMDRNGKAQKTPLQRSYVNTQDGCAAECERVQGCAGWAYRFADKRHVHYQKCFLLNAKHVGYAPPGTTLTGQNDFISGHCFGTL